MVRNFSLVYLCNISKRNFTEIGFVCLFCKVVPFTGEDTFASYVLKCKSNPPNSSKKIDEFKFRICRRRKRNIPLDRNVILEFRFNNDIQVFIKMLQIFLGGWFKIFEAS